MTTVKHITQIHSYLTFSGNCREAMTFYKECLGGDLNLQPVSDSPMADKLPAEMKNTILHSELRKNNLILLGSDMVGSNGLIKGNSVSLMINCSSEEEIRNYYGKLSEGGEATHPLENTFWGALFGAITDKFGNHWLLNYSKINK